MVALFVLAPSFFHYASVTVLKSTLLFTEKTRYNEMFFFYVSWEHICLLWIFWTL